MAALPPSTDFTGSSVTEGGFKTAITALRDFLSGLLGTDGTAAAARTALGAAPAASPTLTGTVAISEAVTLSGDISPSQITANQNDYAPTGFSTASTLRLSTDASRDLTGLAGGADGRVIVIHNIGSNNLVLKDESSSSTAANRFALNADVTLGADQSATLQYDATSSRWRLVAVTSAASGASSDTAAGLIEIAVQSEMETGTDTTRAVVPGRQHFHPSAIKSYIRFNGTGTVAIVANYGAAGLIDNGTGDYTVTYAGFSAVTTISAVASCSNEDTSDFFTTCPFGSGFTTTAVRLATFSGGRAKTDVANVNVWVTGDL